MTAGLVIFRATDTGDDEASLAATEKIEFNDPDSATNPNRCAEHTADSGRNISDNKLPFHNLTKKQDTGFSGIRLVLKLRFYELDGVDNVALTRLLGWLHTSQGSVRGKFTNGRFGLRLDSQPQYNLTPIKASGWLLGTYSLRRVYAHHVVVDVLLHLIHGGDPSELG